MCRIPHSEEFVQEKGRQNCRNLIRKEKIKRKKKSPITAQKALRDPTRDHPACAPHGKGGKFSPEFVCEGEMSLPGALSIPWGFQRDGNREEAPDPRGQGRDEAKPPLWSPSPHKRSCFAAGRRLLRAPGKPIRLGNITQLVFL